MRISARVRLTSAPPARPAMLGRRLCYSSRAVTQAARRSSSHVQFNRYARPLCSKIIGCGSLVPRRPAGCRATDSARRRSPRLLPLPGTFSNHPIPAKHSKINSWVRVYWCQDASKRTPMRRFDQLIDVKREECRECGVPIAPALLPRPHPSADTPPQPDRPATTRASGQIRVPRCGARPPGSSVAGLRPRVAGEGLPVYSWHPAKFEGIDGLEVVPVTPPPLARQP
jgi:hypothetical protein